MTRDEFTLFTKTLKERHPKIAHVKNISVILRKSSDVISRLRSLIFDPKLQKNASKRTCNCAEANNVQVKKLRSEKLTVMPPSDSTKTSLEINFKSTQTRSSQNSQTFRKLTSKSSQISSLTRSYDTQTEQLVTKSQNTQTSLDSTSKSTQVSPSLQSESTQTAENQWSEIFAVQGENAKLKYQLLFNICNTLTEKLERQAKEIEKLERQAEKFAAHSEKISKLESEVQTLRTAQTLN